MPLQIYNTKMRLSSILINIFTPRVKFIDTKIDNESVSLGGRNAQVHTRTRVCSLCNLCSALRAGLII